MADVATLNLWRIAGWDLMSTFAERLKTALKRSGMTQAELSRAVRVTPSSISQWILGQTGPTPSNVFAAADALGCSARWLATGKGPEIDPGIKWASISHDTLELARRISDLPPERQKLLMQIFTVAAPDSKVEQHLPPAPK